MKIVNTGDTYTIYTDNLKTYNQLPIKTYLVCFDKMSGFFLKEQEDIKISEKIYGSHERKADKIINSFKLFNRNLGVILSGDKGIGKSICAKIIATKSLDQGYPIIICDKYIPGIANYISSIKQEVVILFDEFDKTFKCSDHESQDDLQTEMLSLFDGLDQGKKLFIITCNKLSDLNEFLVNRPGRFHYHLRFEYPTEEEIREYLMDKLSADRYSEIDKVVSFADRVKINYDSLRAISFELNLGDTFEEAIKDLNIINTENDYEYSAIAVFTDGTKATCKCVDTSIDFFDLDESVKCVRFNLDNKHCYIDFDPTDNYYDNEHHMTIVKGKDVIDISWYDASGSDIEENKEVDYIAFKRKDLKNIHYVI